MKRYIGFIGLLVLGLGWPGFADDLLWKNISQEIVAANVVLVERLNRKFIYLGTLRGLFKSEDAGDSWRPMSKLNKNINFLLQDNSNRIYAATQAGLFATYDQGRNWKRIFHGSNADENNCLVLAVTRVGEIYLGTNAGLWISKDEGRTWHKASGRLGHISILSLAQDSLNKIVYAAARDRVFKSQDGFASYKEIFTISSQGDHQDGDVKEDNSVEQSGSDKISYLAVDANLPNRVALATDCGVYLSENQGETWNLVSDSGLLSKKIKFILFSQSSALHAISSSGLFVLKDGRWQELSLRLPATDIRFLVIEGWQNLYLATDKGLFKGLQQDLSLVNKEDTSVYFKDEPGIKELQEAAIKYTQVIDPQKIETSRHLARIKAVLPELSVDYDRTISSYSNSNSTRFTVGPAEWGLALRWNLSDLVWSEQQRLIDSQVRLMVELRNDILDEVNKLYFERRKVKMELINLSYLDNNKVEEKKLRLEELAASLDALTGGYFSRQIKER